MPWIGRIISLSETKCSTVNIALIVNIPLIGNRFIPVELVVPHEDEALQLMMIYSNEEDVQWMMTRRDVEDESQARVELTLTV